MTSFMHGVFFRVCKGVLIVFDSKGGIVSGG